MHKTILSITVCFVIFGGIAVAQQPWFDLPKAAPPSRYGNLLINRVSTKYGVQEVTFSHWRHRLQFSCRVCHMELEFEMKVNTTEMTKEKLLNGEYCGACHDGKTAFGQDQCEKCHNGKISYGSGKFKALLKRLPRNRFGNRINWSRAIRKKLIKPRQSIFDDNYAPMPFKKVLSIESEWAMVPPAVFSHGAHTRWLDCSNCHPDIFNIKKKTTEHFTMMNMLDGKFCGACHLNVAFPLDDCKRCHPKIKTGM